LTKYDKALAIDPQNIDALYNKGCCFNDKDEHLKAIDCFNKVIEINQKDAMA